MIVNHEAAGSSPVSRATGAKAPLATTEHEARRERFAALILHGPDGEGGLSVSAAGKALHLSPAQARAWWRSKEVQGYIRDGLEQMRHLTLLKMQREVDTALTTLHRAMLSPEVKKTQVDAARAILSYHLRGEGKEEASTNIQVVVHTGLPEGGMEAQHRRQQRRALQEGDVAEGTFTEL